MSNIEFLFGKEIDTEKWDTVIRKDPYGNMYGHSWYLDMIAPEWNALVLGDYEAVMPIPINKKFGIHYVYRPYGAQQLGIYSKDPISSEIVRCFLNAIPKKYKWVDIFLNQHNPIEELNDANFKTQAQINIELSLEESYATIKSAYSNQTKRNLKKASKYKINLFEHDSPDVLVDLFRRNKGKTLSNLTDYHYNKVKHIMYVLLHKRRGYLLSAYDDRNSICAGIFLAEVENRIIFLFSANDAYGRESHAITWLLDQVFQQKAGGSQIFDFEGSNIQGLREFYGGFGGQELLYYRVTRNTLPWPINYLKK